jgi:hypothetical protein
MSARWVFLAIPLLWIAGVPGHAQKDVYIPEEWDGDPALQEWSWDRSYQSEDFVVFWGPELGPDPTNATPRNLQFDPEAVTSRLEESYDLFVDDIGFVGDEPSTNLGTYKIIVVMNDT